MKSKSYQFALKIRQAGYDGIVRAEVSITIDDKEFMLSKFPAVAGSEIIAKYPLSGLPKLGDYKVNEETMLKINVIVAVTTR